MVSCRACRSRDLVAVSGSEMFKVCRRCMLVQHCGVPSRGVLPASAFGAVERLIERHGLGPDRLVIGVGARALLESLADRGIPVLAIEEDREAAERTRANGIPVIEAQFSPELAEGLAKCGRMADLILVPGFGRLADPARTAEAIALLLKVQGAVELCFAAAVEIVPKQAWAAASSETTLPTLAGMEALFGPEGLHLNDATRAGRHYLMRVTASTERSQSSRLVGLLSEEARLGANRLRFYSNTAADLVGARRSRDGEGAGARP